MTTLTGVPFIYSVGVLAMSDMFSDAHTWFHEFVFSVGTEVHTFQCTPSLESSSNEVVVE
jgi:hypothetical protein